MALNVTKILFRRGTDAQRKTILFEFGEPAYAYDVRRLFIGDGVTSGGVSLGMRNHGLVANLSGNYLNTNLSQTAFNILTAGSVQTGDIIYDRTTSYVFTLTSSNTYPMLSSFAPYAVYPEIQTADFTYNGTKLALNNNSILARHINPSSINHTYLSGGNAVPITIRPGTLINSLLSNQTPANSIKSNPTNGLTTPTDLVIGAPCQVAGRGDSSSTLASVTLTGTGAVRVDGVGNQIRIFTTPSLPLTGTSAGVLMQGGVDMRTFAISATNPPRTLTELANKAYVDTIPSVVQARIVYEWIQSNFLPLSGGIVTGPTRLRVNSGLSVMTGNLGVGIEAGLTNAPLQFANTIANRKAVLWESGNNDHQYYGLGINGNMLRYQVDSSVSSHVFYSAVNSTTSNELFRIRGNGNIGIGNDAPDIKLHINGSVMGTTIGTEEVVRLLRPFTAGVRNPCTAGIAVGSYEAGINGRGRMDLRVSGLPTVGNNFGSIPDITVMTLNANGRVGIGTAAPDQTLDVRGTASVGYLIVTPEDGGNEGGEIQLRGAGANNHIQIDNFAGHARIHTLGQGKQLQVLGGSLAVTGSTTDDNSYFMGRVAVGTSTTNTTYDFNVFDNADVWHVAFGGNTGVVRFGGQTNAGAVIQAFNPSTSVSRDLYLQRDGGRVGIGTDNPAQLLDVRGNIISNGTISAGTPVPTARTSNYTLTESDCGGTVRVDSTAALTVTIPAGLRVGYQVTMIRMGTGGVTIAAGSGVSILQAYNRFRLAARYSAATAIKLSGETWILFGDLIT